MKVRPDRVAVRNDPPTATPGRRLACPLHSRRAQQPYASAEPAHGLGRGRSAENGSVDRRDWIGCGVRRCDGVPLPNDKWAQEIMSGNNWRALDP